MNDFHAFPVDFFCLHLPTLKNIEPLPETRHFFGPRLRGACTSMPSHKSLPCWHKQSRDADKDSSQNLGL